MTDGPVQLAYNVEDDARDAAKWRALCAATKAGLESGNGYANFAGGEDNLFAEVNWQCKGESGMQLTLRWIADNEVRDDLNSALQFGAPRAE
jgi:hypothetical protein